MKIGICDLLEPDTEIAAMKHCSNLEAVDPDYLAELQRKAERYDEIERRARVMGPPSWLRLGFETQALTLDEAVDAAIRVRRSA